MKSLIECVGLCNADSTKCNSVFFMKQNLICKLANLLSYKVSNTNVAMSEELAYIQTSKLEDKQELLGQFSSTVEQKLYHLERKKNIKRLIKNLYQKRQTK
jgi:hypothetical protein